MISSKKPELPKDSASIKPKQAQIKKASEKDIEKFIHGAPMQVRPQAPQEDEIVKYILSLPRSLRDELNYEARRARCKNVSEYILGILAKRQRPV